MGRQPGFAQELELTLAGHMQEQRHENGRKIPTFSIINVPTAYHIKHGHTSNARSQ